MVARADSLLPMSFPPVRPRRAGAWLLLALVVSLMLQTADLGAGISWAQADTSAEDAVILIDVSGSVRGGGSDPTARDIWAPLQQSVSDLVDLMPPGTRIIIVPFSNGANVNNVFPEHGSSETAVVPWLELGGPAEQGRAKQFVRGLNANGTSTWIVAALRYATTQLRGWRDRAQQAGEPPRRQAVYLYTDGLDNSGSADWRAEANSFLSLQRQDLPYLWAVLVRVGAEAIRDCPTGFSTCVTTTRVEPAPSLRAQNQVLDFGTLSAAMPESVQGLELSVRNPGSKPIELTLQLELVPPPNPPDAVTISPTSVTAADRINVTLRVTRPIVPGTYRGTLILNNPQGLFGGSNRVPVTFRYQEPATPTSPPTSTPLPPPTLD